MGVAVNFQGYTPPARFDAIPWTDAQIEEATTETGTYTIIDTVSLGTPDVNPASPAKRSFTTTHGTAKDLWYRVVFVDAFATTSEPTQPVQNTSLSNIYIEPEAIKATLSAAGSSYLDDDLDSAISAACRAIDEACGRRFFTTAADETRLYTATSWNAWNTLRTGTSAPLETDDIASLTSVHVDLDGDGTHETTWTRDTDFFLDPPNAALDGYPYERIVPIAHSGRRLPTWDNAIQVIGKFGWTTAPPEVKQYAKIFAIQLMLRGRQAPFGVISAGVEIGSTTRISRFDPDFDRLLGHLVKPHQLIA